MKSICLISLILLVSSNAVKKNEAVNKTNDITKFRIIFLNYLVTKNLDKTIKVDLINKIITKGNLKKDVQKATYDINDSFVCIQLNENLSPVDSLQIPNPLIRNIEYVDSYGLLGKKQIELDTVELSLRMQLNPSAKFISLKTNNLQNLTLSKIKL